MLRDTVQKIIYQCTIHNYTPLHITTCWHWVKGSQFSLAKQLLKVIIHGSTVLHEFLLESGNIEFGGRGLFLLHKISFKNYCPTFRQLFTKYFSHRILQCTADSFTENISLRRKTTSTAIITCTEKLTSSKCYAPKSTWALNRNWHPFLSGGTINTHVNSQ